MANRLAGESSPYLLQHAGNPVEWWPWGPGAIAEARRRGVPIFLSIGYSTCYWCHVMERESFESAAVAAAMNRDFVCVKVDREERPDIDDIYMAATLILNGHGGWPMSVWLEPEGLRPFYAGTYFPPEARGQLPGLVQVMGAMAEAWRSRRAEVMEQAGALEVAVREHLAARRTPVGIGAEEVSGAVRVLLSIFDRVDGGFGRAPKFPQPSIPEFLLEVRERADPATREAIDLAVRTTLDKMMCGGVFDQVGGGFHRYAVDAHWVVPHFEKMLYDNGMLLGVYARAARAYGDEEYGRVARRVAGYLRREMRVPGGGLATAQDAEVDHREGLNYIWTRAEVEEALGAEDAALACEIYGIDAGTNFKDPHHPETPAVNVLRLEERVDVAAGRRGMRAEELHERLERVQAGLLAARERRKQPHRDDKVIASWNGLAAAGLASAGMLLGERGMIEDAARVLEFVLTRMMDERAGLLRVVRDGEGKTAGFLEDYANVALGCVRLHEADPGLSVAGRSALAWAERLVLMARERFWDGGFFDTRAGAADLFVRTCSTHDGAMPSGVSVMANVLVELARFTGAAAYGEMAAETLRAISPAIAESPVSTINSTRALFRALTTISGAAERLAGSGAVAAAKGDEFQPLEIFADRERIEVGDDLPGELNLVLRIAPGYHLYAADPGPGGKEFVPVRVSVIHGTGLTAYADYPEGTALAGDAGVRVYEGEVELRVAVEKTGEIKGRPLIAVHYQACNDRACLKPSTLELDVAVDVV